jgi:hypothetical protein
LVEGAALRLPIFLSPLLSQSPVPYDFVSPCHPLRSKTVRDQHEAKQVTARIDEAKVEKLLAEHHPLG